MSEPLPDCMMPDGADPCAGYRALLTDVAALRKELDEARGRNAELAVLADAWMRRHDRIAAGQDGGPFPSPVDLPALAAKLARCEGLLLEAQGMLPICYASTKEWGANALNASITAYFAEQEPRNA